MEKRGQLKMSFGMIFSIILIIIFLVLAFYGIKKFIGIGNTAQIVQFKANLQSDIDKLWKGAQGSQNVEYRIPSKIQYICFIDYLSEQKGQYSLVYDDMKNYFMEFENMFFYPIGSSNDLNSIELKHLNLEKTISEKNPFCIANEEGKIKLKIQKDFREATVTITKQ